MSDMSSDNNGKESNPDGIPTDFYKRFKEKLVKLLLDMLIKSYKTAILPQTLQKAMT